ncbi:hypothetical protein AB4Z46_31545 [Variovorax sp. M-6]|uniref:hypothetical protein n=1 Tax=Variovorax sp. M-6 TaxID=3233041 RepID=UPI003F98AD1A
MNYEDAIEVTVTRAQALAEIKRHHRERYTEAEVEFFEDCGDKPTYTGAEVLGWLGY